MLIRPVCGSVNLNVLVTVAAIAITCSMGVRAADDYPSRPVRIVAPYGAGGSYDIVSRTIAQKLSEQINQQVVVDNRPGATGRIGMEIGVKSPPDGYTMITVGSSQTIAPSVHISVPYDLARSIAPIILHGTISYALVIHPSVPAQTVSEFVALSKAKPGALRYGSGGTGGITHLAGELFNNLTGADIAHVPYKSGALATNALLGNEVQMNVLNMLNTLPHIQSGRIRGLGVTGLKRSQFLPSLPTLDEAGVKGYEMIEFHGFAFPAGTPRPIVMRMHDELVKALRSDDLRQRLAQQAVEPLLTSPEEFGSYLLAEQAKYAKIVKTIGLKPD